MVLFDNKKTAKLDFCGGKKQTLFKNKVILTVDKSLLELVKTHSINDIQNIKDHSASLNTIMIRNYPLSIGT